MEEILLEPEQLDLLSKLVAAERSVPRPQRHEFFVSRTFGGDSLTHAGLEGGELAVHYPDIVVLGDAGLLKLKEDEHTASFFVTPQGFRYSDSAGRIADDPPREQDPPLSQDDIRRRLQERLDDLHNLTKKGMAVSQDEIEEWREWAGTVLRNLYGPDSRQLLAFDDVMSGPWDWGYKGATHKGWIERLPRWERLLRTWIREIDEFGQPSQPSVRYVPPASQLEAYVSLKEVIGQARQTLMLVDPYVNEATLLPLISLGPAIAVRILTVDPPNDFGNALAKFKAQWGGNAQARAGRKDLHDRFLVVDDKVYQSGASFKDLGLRGSVLSEIQAEPEKTAIRDDIEAAWNAATPIQ